jgi:CheY-like chemotaxis protein
VSSPVLPRDVGSGVPAGVRPLAIVVDDDDAVRDVVAMTLEDGGFRVRTAPSGAEGLLLVLEETRLAGAGSVELVVTDLKMSGMSGLDLVRAMRDAGRDVPAILMTGFADRASLARAASLGVPVVQKPFARDALVALALGLVERSQALARRSIAG